MNILFIQGGSRLKLSDQGKWYTDPNFNEDVWKRYVELGDSLTILLRKEPKVYDDDMVKCKFNMIPVDMRIKVVPVDDVMRPMRNYFSLVIRRRVKQTIYEAVRQADKVIIRSNSDYTYYCFKACMALNKPYLYEVTGFSYEGLYYQSFWGKLLAWKMEKRQKIMAKYADYALYVTDNALQERYPSEGKMLGCSDVALSNMDDSVISERLERIQEHNGTWVLGTCGRVGDKNKGQHLVIKAMAELDRQGIKNLEYQLVGFGRQKNLKTLAEKCGVADRVKFLGGMPNSQVMAWYDHVDIYVQPSYSEGLSRAIIEAMSQACPVVCSDAGGNGELIEQKYIFSRGDAFGLAKRLKLIMEKRSMQAAAHTNFKRSKDFEKSRLDGMRQAFLEEFVRG